MTGIIVKIDEAFSSGDLNTTYFKDLSFLSPEQLKALTTFVDKVMAGIPLTGKNKPSWLDDSLNIIPLTEAYCRDNYWHYHCGPSYSNSSVQSMTVNLNINLHGVTSSEVIHYTKHDEGHIIVRGFSPIHIPFPQSDDPHNPNPLFE